MQLSYSTYASPVGELTLVASAEGLVAVLWENDSQARVKLPPLVKASEHPILKKAQKQLHEYFSGKRSEFDLPLAPHGTDFQKRVWRVLAEIPYGETRSYLQIARRLQKPTAARAVGMANGRNPISIVVPCHRVIGANGSMTGFAGGLPAKRYLLKLEGLAIQD